MKIHTSKAAEEAKEQAASMAEMGESLRKNWEEALRTGIKLQEEAAHWWSSVFNPSNYAQQWQEQLNAVTRTANSLLPLTQKHMSEMAGFLEKSSRATAGLTRKASDVIQAPGLSEKQAKWAEFWTNSLDVARSNTEELSQISSRAIDSWAEFLRKNTEAATRSARG